MIYPHVLVGFSHSSVGKEPTCSAGDPSWIPGLGRSPGEGVGYPLQYSWASMVAQIVKNPPEMWETWVRSLGWKDPMEEGMATHSRILAWWIPMDRGAWQATVHEVVNSQIWLSDWAQYSIPLYEYNTTYLSIQLLMNIWVVSRNVF